MELTIEILAWVGLGAAFCLAFVTLIVWGDWLFSRWLEVNIRTAGIWHAAQFYIQVAIGLRDREHLAAKYLMARYRDVIEREPGIASEFERLLEIERFDGKTSSVSSR